MRAATVVLLLQAVVVGSALAGDTPSLPSKLDLPPGKRAKARLEITLRTEFSSKDHKVRSLVDEATFEAGLELAFGEARDGLSPVEASFASLAVHRRKRARIVGILSDDERDDRGDATWKTGENDPPPAWKLLVSPRGLAFADASPVTSASARWPGDAWLDRRDERSGEDAKLRRLVRATDLGTLLAAPALPANANGKLEASFPLQAGSSGLTNHLVDLSLVYELEAKEEKPGEVKLQGKLARVDLVRGIGARENTIDRWIDIAFLRKALAATGELEATFDRARGRFREVRSTVMISHEGRFDGGSGKASFSRTVVAREE